MASPQVRTVEYDLSQRVPAYPGMYGLVVGAFDRGPVGVRSMVTGGNNFDTIYGKPKVGSDIAYYLAHTFLSKSRRMWAVRVAATDALYGGVSVGAKFTVPLGIGNGVETTFSGVLPFSRCHPASVSIYMDNRKVGYDNGSGTVTGTEIATGSVTYHNGQVTVQFNSPIPNNAAIFALWGFDTVGLNPGILDPIDYDFDSRVLTQVVHNTAGTTYVDKLVPNPIVAPASAVSSPIESTVRLYDGATLLAYADELGALIDTGAYLDGSASQTFDYATGQLNLTLNSAYTLTAPVHAEYRSYKSEALIVTGDNPGSWTDDYFVMIDDIDPLNNSFTIAVYELDERGVKLKVDSYSVSRDHKKDGFEKQMYVEDKINGRSYYIRTRDNTYLDPQEALPSDSINHTSLTSRQIHQLSGGSKGSAVSVAHYINVLKTFNNKEDVKVDIIVDTLGDRNYQLEIAKLCDRELGGRGDCYGVAYVPFELEASNNYVNDMVNYRRYDLNVTTSFMGLYAGHVKIYDGYNGRDLWIPCSGFVAAAFSFTADQFEPWFPAAGWRRGVLPVLDIYRRFSLGDRDVMYDNDINAMRFRPGKGIAIWGQKTLYGRPTALDRANVRWLLIVVENAIEEFLEEYEFELNDSHTRSLARSAVHDYLGSIKNRRGVYDFDVVCDDTNNSAEQIDQYVMNLDYYLQPAKAAEFIYGRAVITRTGIDFKDVRIQS